MGSTPAGLGLDLVCPLQPEKKIKSNLVFDLHYTKFTVFLKNT